MADKLEEETGRGADERVRQSDPLFKTIIDNSADAIFVAAPGGTLFYVNDAAARLLGHEREALGQMHVSAIWPDEERETLAGYFDQVQREGSLTTEMRLLHADGSRVDVDLNSVVLPDGSVYGSCRDISARKSRIAELRRSEERFRSLFENSLAPILIADEAGNYLAANDAACELLGYPRERLLQMNVAELVSTTPTSSAEQFEAYKDDPNSDGEFAFRRGDGEERVAIYAATRLPAGQYASVMRDVTESRRAEARLRAEKERAQRYLDVAGVMLIGLDRAGRVTMANRAAHETLGADALVGEEWFRLIPADQRAEVRELFEGIIRGELEPRTERVESSVLTASGEVRAIAWHNVVVYDEDGAITGTLSSGEDITELKELQARLAQADRLTSVGVLAGGLAHEINNPLSYLLYNLESLEEDLPRLCAKLQAGHQVSSDRLDDLLERLGHALDGARRIHDVTTSLGAFSRVEKDEPARIQLEPVIDAALRIAQNELRYRARLVREIEPLPPVLAGRGRISQVLLNLLINAIHAIDEGAEEQNEIHLRALSEGDEVCVAITDTGCGVAAADLPRLFEPFFTTKAIGVGSGLGLSIARSIVESYGGRITVESELGRGSCFTVRLPAAPEVSVDEETVAPTDQRTRPIEGDGEAEEAQADARPPRVLIVDDEPAVRQILTRMLASYRTVEASSGDEARALLRDDRDFALLLCDMMMTHTSGMDLHRWLSEEHPALAEKLVFITGGAFTPGARSYLDATGVTTLQKPFGRAQLQKLVADRLATRETDA